MYKGEDYSMAFITNKHIAPYIESFIAISDRIVYVSTKINKRTNTKIIPVYPPTNIHSDDRIELFYEVLNSAIRPTTFKITMGDFNAKIGVK